MAWWLAVLAVAAAAPNPSPFVVYSPNITHSWVLNPSTSPLQYNHDASIARFQGVWIVVWNANTVPREGQPNQQNFMSRSFDDGLTWSEPVEAFSSTAGATNPVPCDPATCKQWQPNLLVVNDTLLCSWTATQSQTSYVSTLTDPNGKWTNRAILFGGNPRPSLLNTTWSTFASQDPVQLSSRRLLAPVVLSDTASAHTRSSVLYSDDGGVTWAASVGAVYSPDYQWEPTVVELNNGSVLMLERNNDRRPPSQGGPLPDQRLRYSVSLDNGVTWEHLSNLPINTVSSRMHVLPLAGRTARRYIMTINDWPAHNYTFVQDRFNPALYFAMTDGIVYTAAVGYGEPGVRGFYPQMFLDDGRVFVVFSSGLSPRGIRVARIDSVPDPDSTSFHLFPRTNVPQGPRPTLLPDHLQFFGGQFVSSVAIPSPSRSFAVGAWVSLTHDGSGAVFDSRLGNNGILFGFTTDRLPFFFASFAGNVAPSKLSSAPANGTWLWCGVIVDTVSNKATFMLGYNGRVDVDTAALPAAPGSWSPTGTTAYVGAHRQEDSSVPGLFGGVHAVTVLDATVTSVAQLAYVANTQRQPIGQSPLPGASPFNVTAATVASMNPSDAAAFSTAWTLPSGFEEGATVAPDKSSVSVCGQASAGVELCPPTASRNTSFTFSFSFNSSSPANFTALTFGSAAAPYRLRVSKSNGAWAAALHAGNSTTMAPVGTLVAPVTPADTTVTLALSRAPDTATVSVNGDSVVTAADTAAVWVYVGEGYRQLHFTNTCFKAAVSSMSASPPRSSC